MADARAGASAPSRVLVAASYAALGSALVWSRLVNLGQPLCCDEIQTVERFVDGGPSTILWGSYVPNNHELFSLAGWATTSLLGDAGTEVALRLWSVVPFVVGVGIVTAWLHARLGALSGLLYLFFATGSPLLIDGSRQARGYGLAFLAMSCVIVAALEALRRPRTWTIAAFCGAGVAGTWTLPHFAIAFFTIGAVLLALSGLRARCAVGLALSALAIGAWYLPHLRAILEAPQQDYGAAIDIRWLPTAPIDQTLVAAVTQGADASFHHDLASVVLVVGFAILIGSSPLLRSRGTTLVLCSGVVTTVVAAWVTRAEVVPRFFSFLLVPLLMLVSSGTAFVLAQTTRAPRVRLSVAVAMLLFVSIVSVSFLARVARYPRESLATVATAIRTQAASSTPVYAYVPYPADLAYHLDRPVLQPRTPADAEAACAARRLVVFVEQRWLMTPVALHCTARRGVVHRRFLQYARGGRVDLWLIPPEPGAKSAEETDR